MLVDVRNGLLLLPTGVPFATAVAAPGVSGRARRMSVNPTTARGVGVTIHLPVGKQKRYPALYLTAIHAHERGKPEGRDPIFFRGSGKPPLIEP